MVKGITASNLAPSLVDHALRRGFALGFHRVNRLDPASWRARGQARMRELILPDLPEEPVAAQVLAQEDRGDHRVTLLTLRFAPGLEAPALLALPAGEGPFPAVIALHDHGSEFRIGKEKCLIPPGPAPEIAAGWWDRFFGARPFGQALLRRGFAVLSVDALSWGGRLGNGYEDQQALAANLEHLGFTAAGLMVWEDLRAAAWLAAQPQIDPARIAAVGFSMGGARAWRLAALSPQVSALVSICWMACLSGLMVEGNNQTRGQSAWWMVHPLLFRDMDLPDIAALAAPKPALFLAGLEDRLFPPATVAEAYAKLVEVWTAWGARDRLELALWPRGHDFAPDRQDFAFDWLQAHLRRGLPDAALSG